MFQLTEQTIDLSSLTQSLKLSEAGAFVTFEGWIRNHNEGKPVRSLEYQVYEALCLSEGKKILAEAKERFNLHAIACTHRYGHLQIGDIAIWIGASSSHRNEAFLATRFVIDQIKLRLPIWKKEHYVDQAPEWVNCQHHSTHVHFKEQDYYQKQKSVIDQEKLGSKKALIIGAGGLGCPVATALTMAGVGSIDVLDFDTVDISNLHRQPLYTPADVGEKKAVIAASRLKQLNPFVHLHAVDARVTPQNLREILKGYDLVMDCTDNLETKFLIHDACFALSTPLVSASIYRFEGQVRTFAPGAGHGCLRCQYSSTPSDEGLGNCNDFGVLGAAVSAIGAIQANEAIQYLSSGKNASLAHTVYFDLAELSTTKVKNLKKPACPTCKGEITPVTSITESIDLTAADLDESCELVDVREQPDEILDRYTGSSKKIVVYCYKGIRSRKLVTKYRERGFKNFYSLVGGACSL